MKVAGLIGLFTAIALTGFVIAVAAWLWRVL